MQLKEGIKKIAQLQEIDKDIYQLALRKDKDIPAEIEALEDLIDQKQRDFASFKEKVNRLELEKRNKEGELSQKEENLKKARSQLYQLKSNKEYQVKLKEIASIEADISCVEEEVIKSLDTIDQEKGKIKKEKEGVDQQAGKLKQKNDQLKKESQEIEEKVRGLENKRKHYAEGVDKKILNQYESLLKKRSGLAIVSVKNSNCNACHMTVNHQKINEIKMYDKLILCESCVRILYIPEDLELRVL